MLSPDKSALHDAVGVRPALLWRWPLRPACCVKRETVCLSVRLCVCVCHTTGQARPSDYSARPGPARFLPEILQPGPARSGSNPHYTEYTPNLAWNPGLYSTILLISGIQCWISGYPRPTIVGTLQLGHLHCQSPATVELRRWGSQLNSTRRRVASL